jgi:hypothetical protein
VDTALDELTVRLNVLPGQLQDPAGNFRALPQTFELRPNARDTDLGVGVLELLPPVLQTGHIVGYRINPLVVALPGENVPVAGAVYLTQPNGLQSYVSYTDDDGRFEVWAVPGADYQLQVVPDDPMLPRHTATLDVLDPMEELELDLGVGAPVFGHVSIAGFPIGGARVRVVDATGISSMSAESDGAGLYQLRATPGLWRVVCDGRDNGRDPSLDLGEIELADPGLVVDVSYPPILTAFLDGRVQSATGAPVGDATVRLVYEGGKGFAGLNASWVGEAITNEDGRFTVSSVPGTFNIEVLPPEGTEGESFSPIRLTDLVLAEGENTLGTLALPPLVTVSGLVQAEGAEGLGLGSAQVSCTEIGFSGRSFDAFTEVDGVFSLEMPSVPMICDVSPPSSSSGLARRRAPIDPSQATSGFRFELPTGTLVSGVVNLGDVPEAYAVVELRDVNDVLYGSGLTGPDGRFELRVDLASMQ